MIDQHKLISQWSEAGTPKQALVAKLLDNDSAIKRFAFGRNEQSIDLNRKIDLDGFIDDFADDRTYDGKPVFKVEHVLSDPNAIVVNCISSVVPRKAQGRFSDADFKNILNYCDIYRIHSHISLPDYVTEMREDFATNNSMWQNVFSALTDTASKQILNDIISFRLTGDFTYLNRYDFRPSDQYFEAFLECKNEVFVDAGGFTGDTTEEFCKQYPDYRNVHLIEPSAENLQQAKERLLNHKHINFIEKGVSDKVEQLWFTSDSGSAASVSDEGNIIIDVEPMDELISETVSFIKMDLEGWELKALAGARHHILNDHPKLAIAVYHKASDFWEIYNFIMNIRSDYTIYLRHYTEGWSETIMYFLPQQ